MLTGALMCLGCDNDTPGVTVKPREKPQLAPTTATAPTAPTADPHAGGTMPTELPPGHPPIGRTPADIPGHPPIESDTGDTAAAKPIFTPPAEWVALPARPMTEQVFQLPRAEGDTEDADLTISTLGRDVPFQLNVRRWCGQFELPEGESCDKVGHSALPEAKMGVLYVEFAGTYRPGSMMGGPAPDPKPGYRMLAFQLSSPGFPWYVRVVGPDKTIQFWKEAILTFVRDAHLP